MVRWGILGLGKIAEKFGEAIQEVENAKLIAISSLNDNKLNFFGKKYNILEKYRFNTYENLLNCNEVDAVYIATLNNTHSNLIIKAAKAEKNILCEKPMALNQEEAKEVFRQLNISKVFFLEAFAYRSHPQTEAIVNLIKNDEIGEIRHLASSFGFSEKNKYKFYPNNRLFSKKLGGGAILDVGCYTTSFALLIEAISKNDDYVFNFRLKDSIGSLNFRGTDDEAYTTLVFDSGLEARLNAAIRKKIDNTSLIVGTKGKIIINNPWLPPKKSFIDVENKFKKYRKEIQSKYSIYACSINIATEQIMNKSTENKYPLMSWKDSKTNMEIISKWKDLLNK
tara:strand:- start:1059 stop:2072 length:1014 start_codon:yes stop_codon:yes gene_type:complete